MRRFAVLCCLLPVLGAGPGRAAPPVVGAIDVAVTHPEIAKQVFNQLGPSSNGLVGWVIALPASADEDPYTLVRTSPLPGNPDVWFYKDAGGQIGSICSSVAANEDGLVDSTTETGVICPGPDVAAWAVVVLFTGANVSFSFNR